MKLKKLLASALAGVLTLSGAFSFIPTGEVLASAEETVAVDSNEANENVTVLYDAPLTGVELGVFELGKSIEGSKLRFTYESGSYANYEIIGLAARANDNSWTWLQSENAFISEGLGTTSVVEMTYQDFENFVGVDETDLRSYVFQDWGLAKGSNFKIELITPIVKENVTEVFNDKLSYDVTFSSYELGKNIDGSKIRFTYTSDTDINNAVLAFQYNQETLDPALYSRGYNQEVVATFTYTDIINYLGCDYDCSYIEVLNWNLKDNTNLKVELITPIKTELTSVVYEGDVKDNNFISFSPFELGKSVDNSQIRITFKSIKPINWGTFGVSAQEKSYGDLLGGNIYYFSKGEGKYTTLVYNYTEFVEQVGMGDDLAFFDFNDWGLTYLKIELLTPIVSEKVDVLYDGSINLTEFTPAQLGKNIDGSKIRITYTSGMPLNWRVLGISGKEKNTWKWVQNKYALFSKGENIETTCVFSYRDFVDYIGIGDNVECFVFQDWGLAADSNVKIELITPDNSKNIKVLYDDVIEQWGSVEFTPSQLGKGINGAILRVTYDPSDDIMDNQAVIGIAGKSKDGKWLQDRSNPAFVKTQNGTNIQQLTYAEFARLAKLTESNVGYYVFSNWNLKDNTNVRIELLTPKQTDPDIPVDPTPEIKTTVVFDGKIDLTEISPEQLGKGIEGAMLTLTYTSAEDAKAGYGVLGIAGKNYDWEWEQAAYDPAFVTSGPGETDTVTLSYDAFVEMAGIGDDLRYFVFQDWGLAQDVEANCKIELTTPVQYFAEMTLYDDVLAPDGEVDMSPAELGQNIPGAKIQFTYTSASPECWDVVGLAGKAKDTLDWKSCDMSFASEGECTTTTLTFTYADFVEYVGVGDDLECFVFQNWGMEEGSKFIIKLIIPAEAGQDLLTLNLYTGDLADDAASFSPAQLGALTPGTAIKITYTGAGEEGEDAVGIGAISENDEWLEGKNCLASVGENEENTYTTTYEDFVTFVGITEPVKAYVFQDWGLLADTDCIIDLVLPVTSDAV